MMATHERWETVRARRAAKRGVRADQAKREAVVAQAIEDAVRLAELRAGAGITQRELAERMGVRVAPRDVDVMKVGACS